LSSDNIIEFFNPVKYIIKDENNENKYVINIIYYIYIYIYTHIIFFLMHNLFFNLLI